MSSDEELHDIDDGGVELNGAGGKRRKLLRACDVCRRKKIRCDAHSKPNQSKCTHCTTYKFDCTFIEGAKKRSPPKAYIDDLEKRVESLEALVRRIAPNVNIEEEVGPSFTKHTWAAVRAATATAGAKTSRPSTSSAGGPSTPLQVLPHAKASSPTMPQIVFQRTHPAAISVRKVSVDQQAAQEDLENSDNERNFTHEDGSTTKHIESELEKMHVTPGLKRFHGKSSGVTLVQAALTLKEEVTGIQFDGKAARSENIRPKFWKPSPWEWMSTSLPSVDSLKFPPPELLAVLVERCFEDVLYYMPVVHRPSFEADLKADRHRHDIDFARLVLIICSVGARYCQDPRTCLTSPDGGDVEWSSSGWVYFAQVYQMKKPMLASVKLIDLQILALSATYLQGTSAPHASWLIVGIGLRFAEDIGAHREKVYSKDSCFENQVWKRAFWALVSMDKMLSASLGRPTCVNDEDIDTHLPLEVDDDGWDDTTKEWVQPIDKPSSMAFFIHNIKLVGILAHAMRTIYSINKSKVHLGFIGTEWEQHTVSELDSALNQWQDAIPSHLRWDSHMQGPFYRQAAALRIAFYYVQITVHRPFITLSPNTRRVSPLSLPSLAICANAARSSAHILDICMEISAPATWTMMAFISGLVLMISIWEARRAGLNVDVSTQVADVHTCLRYLRRWENRTHLSGRLYDILREVASMGEVPIPPSAQPTPPDTAAGAPTVQNKKRDRDSLDCSPPEPSWPTGSVGPSPRVQSASYAAVPRAPSLFNESNSTPTSTSSPCVPPSPAGSSQHQFNPPSFHTASPPKNHQLFVPHVDTQPAIPWAPPAAPPSTAYPASQASPTAATAASAVAPDSTWENYHIAGSSIPGLNMGFQRMPGFNPTFSSNMDAMSPNSFLHDLLGPLAAPNEQSIAADAQIMQPEYWNQEPLAQWNWMNDITSSFGNQMPRNKM